MRGESPAAPFLELCCRLQLGWNHGQRGGGRHAVGLGRERMPAERQTGRHLKSGTACGHSIHVARRRPVFLLGGGEFRSVLERDRQAGRRTVADVDVYSRRRSFLDDDGGRQHPPPRRHFRVREGRFDLLVGMGGDSQRTQHLDQRGGRNVVLQPIPAVERRPDAVSIREPVKQVLVNGGVRSGWHRRGVGGLLDGSVGHVRLVCDVIRPKVHTAPRATQARQLVPIIAGRWWPSQLFRQHDAPNPKPSLTYLSERRSKHPHT